MSLLPKSLSLLAAFASVAITAGGAQASVRGASPLVARPLVSSPRSLQGGGSNGKCASKGGVTVNPCPVHVGSSNPQQMVTVNAPNGSTVTEKDNCSAKGIAQVAGSGSSYEVIAGATSGKCKATFTAKDGKGNKSGKATLGITNKGL